MSSTIDSRSSSSNSSSVLVAGLALFSMFFGAGDLIWPLILGGSAGDQNGFAALGLLITGVSLPLLGLVSMMLFQGNYQAFFGRIGKIPAFCVIFLVQIILGPVGSIPRLFTLSHATLKPYFPVELSLFAFSVVASVLVFALTLRPKKIIDILGLALTPLLLICLSAILAIGFYYCPEMKEVSLTSWDAFSHGLNTGYNTLDLIASFIFAPLVLSHFVSKEETDSPEGQKEAFKKMLKASLLAAGLLSLMYLGLTFISSCYTPLLPVGHKPEERLSAIALYLLGPYGAFVACIAVALACLTTAIPLVSIFATYLREELMGNSQVNIRIPTGVSLVITLGISVALASMGFMGIAKMLAPVLQMLCPGLIVLSVLNIFHQLYETRVPKLPIFVTFALSTLRYYVWI